MLELTVGCQDVPDGVPVARRLFEVDRTNAAEAVNPVLTQSLRRRRKRWGPTPLYVDGKFMGILNYHELHPELPTRWERVALPDEIMVLRRFAWAELFAAHGVDLSKIKAVHYYGGRNRISIVDGDEFRKVGNSMRFSYNSGEGGKVRQRPPKDGVDYNTSIDIVRAAAVYVDREPPGYKRGNIKFSDGKEIPVRDERGKINIPYSDGDQHGGTRVYLDGRYIGAFRRRALTSQMLSDPSDTESPYLLEKVLESMGVERSKIKRIQIIAQGDQRVADWGSEALATLGERTFVLSQHSRGRIQVSNIKNKILSAFMLYAELEPAERSQPPGNGSGGHHGENGKANDSVRP